MDKNHLETKDCLNMQYDVSLHSWPYPKRPSTEIIHASQVVSNTKLSLEQIDRILGNYAASAGISQSAKDLQLSKRTIKKYYDGLTLRLYAVGYYRYFFDFPYCHQWYDLRETNLHQVPFLGLNFNNSDAHLSARVWNLKAIVDDELASLQSFLSPSQRLVQEGRRMSELLHSEWLLRARASDEIFVSRLIEKKRSLYKSLIALTGPLNVKPSLPSLAIALMFWNLLRDTSPAARGNDVYDPDVNRTWWLAKARKSALQISRSQAKNLTAPSTTDASDLTHGLSFAYFILERDFPHKEPIYWKDNPAIWNALNYETLHPGAIETHQHLPFRRRKITKRVK